MRLVLNINALDSTPVFFQFYQLGKIVLTQNIRFCVSGRSFTPGSFWKFRSVFNYVLWVPPENASRLQTVKRRVLFSTLLTTVNALNSFHFGREYIMVVL